MAFGIKLHICLLVIVLFFHRHYADAQITNEKRSNWYGYEKVDFEFNGKPAFIIQPEKPLPSNPWVWRAYFPGWHIAIDSILVSRGFQVAYINTNDLFGHAQAINTWDEFYNYLVIEKKFAPKVALEAISRGGLYAYAWAKRNPDKVSCIYAEAPVCDIKSWPGGKGKSAGSPADWEKLLKIYNFTEEQALQFADNPKDNLKGLAAFKVPLLHVIGLEDKIVPNQENTYMLADNYVKLGGPISIFPMTRGKQTLEGHHFPIENPSQFADFIYRNSYPVKEILPKNKFVQLNGGLANFLYRVKTEKAATVAFLGGSITFGGGWREKTMTFLQEQFPETRFTFINAGIPSLGSLPHVFRLEQDVLIKGRIDLLFLESAVNDLANGTPEQTQRRALEGIIRHSYSANPNINIILMAFADEFKLANYQAEKEPTEVKVHQELATHYQLPFINLAEEVSRRIIAKEFSWEYDFKNLHPSPFGHEIYTQTIKHLFNQATALPANKSLFKVKLPVAMDKQNYQKGNYYNLSNAGKLNGFTLIPNWKPTDITATRSGFVDVPMLVSDKPGASLEVPFTGNAIGMALISGPDAGIIRYAIDKGPEKTLDSFTQWSHSLHLPWFLLLQDNLQPGKHILHLKIDENSNPKSTGRALRIVNFLVNK